MRRASPLYVFDDENFATANKDKSMKIWNRRGVGRDGYNPPNHSELFEYACSDACLVRAVV